MQKLLLDKVLNPFAKLYEGLGNRVRDIIFVTSFVLLLLYNVFKSLLPDTVPYFAIYVFGSICFVIAILSMMRPNMKPIEFRKIPFALWLIGGTIILIASLCYNIDWISEAIVILVFCPLTYIVWGNTDFRWILRLLSRACIFSFLVHMSASAFLVPVNGRQYGGLFNNVNGAGQYLVLVFSCLLIECFREHRRKWVHILSFVLLGMCGSLVFYTNSRTSIASALTVLVVVVGMFLIRDWRNNTREMYKRVLCVILSVAVMLPTTIYLLRGGYEATGWLREMSSLNFATDTDSENGGIGTFFEYAKIKTEIADRDMEAISAGRTAIWKEYLSRSTLIGSGVEEAFYVESRNIYYTTAHMTWITYSFRYGYIGAIILFIYSSIMGVIALLYAWKKKGDPWSLLPLAISLVFLIVSLLESVNTPYNYMITLFYYLIQTLLISKGVKKGPKDNEENISEN